MEYREKETKNREDTSAKVSFVEVKKRLNTYLFLLLVKVVNDDTNEEI